MLTGCRRRRFNRQALEKADIDRRHPLLVGFVQGGTDTLPHLADIAGPVVLQQGLLRIRGEAADASVAAPRLLRQDLVGPAQDSPFAILDGRDPHRVTGENTGKFFIEPAEAQQVIHGIGQQGHKAGPRQVARGLAVGQHAAADLPGQFQLRVAVHQVGRLEYQGLALAAFQFQGDPFQCLLATAKSAAIYRHQVLWGAPPLLMDDTGDVQLAGAARADDRHRDVNPCQENGLVYGTFHIVGDVALQLLFRRQGRPLQQRGLGLAVSPVGITRQAGRQVIRGGHAGHKRRLVPTAVRGAVQHHTAQQTVGRFQWQDRTIGFRRR